MNHKEQAAALRQSCWTAAPNFMECAEPLLVEKIIGKHISTYKEGVGRDGSPEGFDSIGGTAEFTNHISITNLLSSPIVDKCEGILRDTGSSLTDTPESHGKHVLTCRLASLTDTSGVSRNARFNIIIIIIIIIIATWAQNEHSGVATAEDVAIGQRLLF